MKSRSIFRNKFEETAQSVQHGIMTWKILFSPHVYQAVSILPEDKGRTVSTPVVIASHSDCARHVLFPAHL
jgi:hypothetical protein